MGRIFLNGVDYSAPSGMAGVVSKNANGLAPKLPNENTTTKFLRQDGTWAVPPDTNTTYGNMTGATASAAGASGLAPAPPAGANTKFLRGDGTWQAVSGGSEGVDGYSKFVKITITLTNTSLEATDNRILGNKTITYTDINGNALSLDQIWVPSGFQASMILSGGTGMMAITDIGTYSDVSHPNTTSSGVYLISNPSAYIANTPFSGSTVIIAKIT